MRPRLGILAFQPIQYQTPLYQRLARRGAVQPDVLYLSDRGHRPEVNSEFGVPVAWDIDLLSGYTHHFLSSGHGGLVGRARALARWAAAQDAVVVHGYNDPWMLLAMLICKCRGIPYLMRCDSGPAGASAGIRRGLRHIVARVTIYHSAACLAIGQLNHEFYRRYGARRIVFAPYSIDDERFARPPKLGRTDLLLRLGLKDDRHVIMYCGKLYPGKRPLDLVAAARILSEKVILLFAGDGLLAGQIRDSLAPGDGVVTGFVNQSELPAYYHSADILVLPSAAEKWGLVINEAMAAGTLPVASDRVGAVPDLVSGIGEVYACGDIADLAEALRRALTQVKEPGSRDRVRQHAAGHSLDRTAAGFEEAVLMVSTESSR